MTASVFLQGSPLRLVGEATCERRVQIRSKISREFLAEKPPTTFFKKILPAGFFAAGIDGKEECVVRFRRPLIAGSVADHQDLTGRVIFRDR